MVKRRLVWVAVLVVGAACSSRQAVFEPNVPVGTVAREIDELLSDPTFANAHWGVMIQSVGTGEIWYRRNNWKLFMPASNMKLVTAAVALSRLGSDHRFRTAIAACGAVDDGVLRGDLLVVGRGDPTFSDRFHDGNGRAPFLQWADSLRDHGIRSIDGRITGDDSYFPDPGAGPGWSWDYLDAAYAAEVGALLFNEGAARIVVRRDAAGGVIAATSPPTAYFTVRSAVSVVEDTTDVRLEATRHPFSNVVELRGELSSTADSASRWVAAHDPTMFFLTNLTETLRSVGVAVGGDPARHDASCGARPLFVHESVPLGEVVIPFLKESQNQIGEMLLRYLGAAATDTGSIGAGRRVVQTALRGWGIPDDQYVYVDGSGLSRYNYLSPEAIVRLLRAIAREREFSAFLEALPVAGVDGTLRRRMVGTVAQGNVRAKTGFISNARALSGYVTTADGEQLAFSIIANNFTVSTRAVEYVSDLILERLASVRRP